MKKDIVVVHKGSLLTDEELVSAFKGIGGHPVIDGVFEVCRRLEDRYMELAMGEKIEAAFAVEKIEAVRSVIDEVIVLVDAGKDLS